MKECDLPAIPEWAQTSFKGIEPLHLVHNLAYSSALEPHNLLVFGATDGKLDIAVLSIIHMIHHHGNRSTCVYLAPTQARIDEIVKNLSDRLTAYHVEVKPQSEDHTLNGQIVVTTAEDWNVLTLHRGFRSCARSLKLFIVDELDFNNERSGPIIESILARTVRENVTTKECNIRLVGLSATLPIDYNDIAAFLRVIPDEGLFYCDSSYTYIPLSRDYNEVSEVKKDERVNSVCNEKDFQAKLIDHLNAEIALGTVLNIKEAYDWFQYTYSYHCKSRHPSPDSQTLEWKARMISKAISGLLEINFVEHDRVNKSFHTTKFGQIAAYYSISHLTVLSYLNQLEEAMEVNQICKLLSQTEELRYIISRDCDKTELERLQQGVFPFHGAERFLRALTEITMCFGWANLAYKIFNFRQQLTSGIGTNLLEDTLQPPKLLVDARALRISCTILDIDLFIEMDFEWDDKVHGSAQSYWIVVLNTHRELILHYEYLLLKSSDDKIRKLNFIVNTKETVNSISILVLSDRWTRLSSLIYVGIVPRTLPCVVPCLEDLKFILPLVPVSNLKNPSYEACYRDMEYFDYVDSQFFHTLYHCNENVFIGASTGRCKEFAILRDHNITGEDMCVVYVSTSEAHAKRHYCEWKNRFGNGGLNLRVGQLTGTAETDLILFNKCHILICTPDKWIGLPLILDGNFRGVSLLIIDDIHFVGSRVGGHMLECMISEFLAGMVGHTETRLVALSVPLSSANAIQLKTWIGVKSTDAFNFGCAELQVQGVDIRDVDERMMVMAKLCHSSIIQHVEDNWKPPTLVFVHSWRHVKMTAMELSTYSVAKPFLLMSQKELEPILNQISHKVLKVTLSHGVAYLHQNLPKHDQEVVTKLFKDGKIQICVLSSSMCWDTTLNAHLVIVMGTQHYDWGEDTLSEYSLAEMMQMMGHAHNPLLFRPGKCIILCHAPRKEYYQKFMIEQFSLETHLLHFLPETIHGRIVSGVIKSVEDAAYFLCSTYTHFRLTRSADCYDQNSTDCEIEKQVYDMLLQKALKVVRDLVTDGLVGVTEDGSLFPTTQ